jgi:hypothetical protein
MMGRFADQRSWRRWMTPRVSLEGDLAQNLHSTLQAEVDEQGQAVHRHRSSSSHHGKEAEVAA